jgi:hypothetical protein
LIPYRLSTILCSKFRRSFDIYTVRYYSSSYWTTIPNILDTKNCLYNTCVLSFEGSCERGCCSQSKSVTRARSTYYIRYSKAALRHEYMSSSHELPPPWLDGTSLETAKEKHVLHPIEIRSCQPDMHVGGGTLPLFCGWAISNEVIT